MALVVSNRPGTITVINVPDISGIGILSVYGMPSNAAIITQAFRLDVEARTSLDYSISNTKYLYVYGTSLNQLTVQFALYPFVDCTPARSIFSFLSFLDGRLVSAYGTPRITVAVDTIAWRGVITKASVVTGQLQHSPEIAVGEFTAIGNFL